MQYTCVRAGLQLTLALCVAFIPDMCESWPTTYPCTVCHLHT